MYGYGQKARNPIIFRIRSAAKKNNRFDDPMFRPVVFIAMGSMEINCGGSMGTRLRKLTLISVGSKIGIIAW